MGKKFVDAVYKHTPEESHDRLIKHLTKILPDADLQQIERVLGKK